MSPIDLDAVVGEAASDLDLPEDWMHAVGSMAAELRAARLFEEHVRAWFAHSPDARVCEVVAVFDRRAHQLGGPGQQSPPADPVVPPAGDQCAGGDPTSPATAATHPRRAAGAPTQRSR